MNRKAQTIEPIIVKFLIAFILFALVGMIFFTWANEGASKYGVSDYNQTVMSQLDISDEVNDTFSGLNDIANPPNASAGSGQSQSDTLLGTAGGIGRFIFVVPKFVGAVIGVASSEYGIDPRIIFFARMVIVAIAIAIFIQIAIGRS